MSIKKNKTNFLFIIVTICIGIFPAISIAQTVGMSNPALNPAAEYCKDLGYEYFIKSMSEGDYGYCRMPDGVEIEGWKFLQGEEGIEYGYCGKQGYSPKIVSGEQCHYSQKCVVCVLDDNTEVEVTQLIDQKKEAEKDKETQQPDKKNSLIIFVFLIIIIFIVIIIAYFVLKNKNNRNQLDDYS